MIVRPASSSPAKAAMVQIGIPMTPISVTLKRRRNRNMTRLASRAPIIRLIQTFLIEDST